MRKLKLSQAEIDKLVVIDRVEARRLVYGVASNDACFVIKIAGSNIWQYDLWHSMLKRCLTGKYKLLNKTYEQVVVCDEWLSFGNFLEWLNKEVGYSGQPVGFELDKDLMVFGNKCYSPATCSFVPKHINQILTNTVHGVSIKRNQIGRFSKSFCMYGTTVNVGTFDTADQCRDAYASVKESHVRRVAEQYKGVIKPAVYENLISWRLDISS